MKKYKKIKKEAIDYEIISANCDICGKKSEILGGILLDVTEITISFGYGSTLDGDCYKILLCQECIEKYIFNNLIKDKDYYEIHTEHYEEDYEEEEYENENKN
jgi:hypothetical protein